MGDHPVSDLFYPPINYQPRVDPKQFVAEVGTKNHAIPLLGVDEKKISAAAKAVHDLNPGPPVNYFKNHRHEIADNEAFIAYDKECVARYSAGILDLDAKIAETEIRIKKCDQLLVKNRTQTVLGAKKNHERVLENLTYSRKDLVRKRDGKLAHAAGCQRILDRLPWDLIKRDEKAYREEQAALESVVPKSW
ncbi:MAG TPA: hypothetical protein VNY29_17830 [Terriglobales bacterium]|jgi:hypothetical protein|nr:hypothetical protein [Terriglobales bacterium]